MGKLLQREGEYILVSVLLYMVVTQTVLMLGSESWALSDAMMQMAEGTHMGFLKQITVKRAQRQANGN